MRAIFINAHERKVEEVEISDWREISPKLGCHLFTCVDLNMKGETLYVDDEGLLTLTDETPFIFFKGGYQPYAGNGLIMGTDRNTGESVASKLTVEEVKKMVRFMSLLDVQILSKLQGLEYAESMMN